MADKYKIAESWMGIWVHTGPGISYPKTSVIYGKDNKTYTVTERKGYWLNLEGVGWCCDRDSNGMIVLKKVENEKNSTRKVESDELQEESNPTEVDEESYAYIPGTEIIEQTEDEYLEDLEDNLAISNLRSVFGIPYQFMPSIDTRVDGSDNINKIGRKYAKEIITTMPLLLIVPGKPVFMANYNNQDRRNVLEYFKDLATNHESDLRDTVFGEKFGKYYSLEYLDYYN